MFCLSEHKIIIIEKNTQIQQNKKKQHSLEQKIRSIEEEENFDELNS